MSEEVTYRWIDGPTATDAEWNEIDRLLASRGWMSLNRQTSRMLVAERGSEIIGFNCIQLIPYVGPLYLRPRERASGVAEELVDQMQAFLTEANARGYIAVCEHPIAAKMCEARGMVKVTYPVYVSVAEGVPVMEVN
jgi:hypothetical protein